MFYIERILDITLLTALGIGRREGRREGIRKLGNGGSKEANEEMTRS